ncbi:uncharacterized protein K489DRAFT_401983 [Dissoconium aciculare CBS 342.82]|uniref:Mediator of RNA polymerase II transcription subunit 22 n=1 Tax=Dissoconium aciculare CBS 342.82 TaxID=1314786 RepID=A0A6J3M2H7_9PEZI|nr:uncharacterized protein K489DRAFT_401983 [Dissoconium aciculare CBS 342.82]KAF1822221.1 hypothetical protein K489DRAFT_401983 [Dissoconium aciculare CBS 342.82]
MDDNSLRNTRGIHARITEIRKELILRYGNIIAAVSNSTDPATTAALDSDRTSTAIAQHQIQVSTAGLVKAAEDLQTLIRQLQEFWLFGQLNTLGDGAVKAETDRDSEAVAKTIAELLERRERTGQAN